MKEKTPTQVQVTIMYQIKTLNPLWRIDYGVHACFAHEDGLSVRLCTRNNGSKVNIDIHYKRGTDTYTIKAYNIKGVDCETIYDQDLIMCDQLDDIIKHILRKATQNSRA